MSPSQLDEAAIVDIARRIESRDVRSDYVLQATGNNTALRARVEALLDALDKRNFLDAAPIIDDTENLSTIAEKPGTEIATYKLREQIGEGGFGVVFVAEQEKPIQRKVALKIIKPGMDTKEVIARFEAERQALALMSHPNIAKVLDAGTTESGRPYFVMELVQGVPITEYCDRYKLSTRERLKLFVAVCYAVQHAHQKGIIHRDLKPSNVLVTEVDGCSVVKVIDFGVAKAINQRLTEQTIYTRFQQMVGTPMYMSPEQANLSGLDVDTRSDVYSLGVLLYELVTGQTPFDKQRFNEAAYDEIRRIIREEDPSKPSTKVSSLGNEADTVSQLRQTDAQRLSQSLRGDVDWVVMKAIDKDRSRRYQTASSFAEDVERYLRDDPIEARPPSVAYRLSKFARRNKGPVAAIAAVLISLIVGISGTTVALIRANQFAQTAAKNAAAAALQAKNAQLAKQQLEHANVQLVGRNEQVRRMLLHQAFATAMDADRDKTGHLIEMATQAGLSESQREFIVGLLEYAAGEARVAAIHLQHAVTLDPSNMPAKCLLCRTAAERGDWYEYIRLLGEVNEMTPIQAEDFAFMALAVIIVGSPDRALELSRRGRDLFASPITRVVYANALQNYGYLKRDLNSIEQAFDELEEARRILGEDHASVLHYSLLTNDGYIAVCRERGEEPLERLRRANEYASQLRESRNPVAVASAANHFTYIAGDLDSGEAAWQRAVDLEEGSLLRCYYAAFLLRRHGIDRAIEELDRLPRDFFAGRAIQAVLLALTRDGRAKSQRILSEITAVTPMERYRLIQVPLLLGNHEEVNKLGREWSEDPKTPRDTAISIDYFRGALDEDELKERKKNVDFDIAMKALSVGGEAGRSKARVHFQRIVDRGDYLWPAFGYAWAAGYLAEMERRPGWPDEERDAIDSQPGKGP